MLLLHWGSYHWAHNLWVLIIYVFFLPVMLPSVVPRLATDLAVRMFPGVWKLLSFLRLPLEKVMVLYSSILPGKSHGWRNLVGCSPWGREESDMTERLPFPSLSLPRMELHSYLFCLSFYLLYFFLPPFEDNGLLFWVPDVLCWHSEVVLWNLLSVQMFF